MKRQVKKVAVLGSGVMGSAIAAHFANAGVPSLVLDIVVEGSARNSLADRNVKALAKMKPSPLFAPARLAMIETGNLEDDLPRLSEADWVIEAVREEMGIKEELFGRIAEHIAPDAVLSSNTSGLSLERMASGLPATLRPRFLGTHFFNPPRYMRLLELIPTTETSAEVLEWVSWFSRTRLGKGIVRAKDTPNFIANRIGTHAMMVAIRVMEQMGLTVEEVDTLTGPALGRPKTGTFRLADLVGLDTLLHVARNTYDAIPDDESREIFAPPEFLSKMVEAGLLGRKAGAGFYKKEGRNILTLDLETQQYREKRKPDFPELAALKSIEDNGARLCALIRGDGRAAEAAWRVLAPTLAYSAMRLGEIAEDAATLDQALKLGFSWQYGPFETWDLLGFRPTTERLRADGHALPRWIDALYDEDGSRLYRRQDDVDRSPTADPGVTVAVPDDPRAIRFAVLHKDKREVRSNPSGSLIDLGDGVLGLEFHSKMNSLDMDSIAMMLEAADEAEANWQALVVANDGDNFSVGANLMMLVQHATEGNWEAIREVVRAFQNANDRLEQCAVPVVTVPHGMALGGGCEVTLAGNATHAAAESYIGLVEAGAGLIPAGGGCLRLYRRNVGRLADPADLYTALRKSFETIGMAKVSTSAEEARELGYLGPQDAWAMNRDYRVADAKQIALALARSGYVSPTPERAIPVMGRAGVAVIEAGLVNMTEGRFISEHDRKIGHELALVLCGGDVAGPTSISERHMLELECEAFVRLAGEPKTQERIGSLLKTGKPLRN